MFTLGSKKNIDEILYFTMWKNWNYYVVYDSRNPLVGIISMKKSFSWNKFESSNLNKFYKNFLKNISEFVYLHQNITLFTKSHNLRGKVTKSPEYFILPMYRHSVTNGYVFSFCNIFYEI